MCFVIKVLANINLSCQSLIGSLFWLQTKIIFRSRFMTILNSTDEFLITAITLSAFSATHPYWLVEPCPLRTIIRNRRKGEVWIIIILIYFQQNALYLHLFKVWNPCMFKIIISNACTWDLPHMKDRKKSRDKFKRTGKFVFALYAYKSLCPDHPYL